MTYTGKNASRDCLYFCQISGNEKDIGISKRTTSHARISYSSREICIDSGSFINISDRIVKKIISTETKIYKLSILLEYSVDFRSYGACKSVFKRDRVDLNFDF